jgi:hypothetical protein
LGYHGNEINKPLHSNGHVLIDAHVGSKFQNLEVMGDKSLIMRLAVHSTALSVCHAIQLRKVGSMAELNSGTITAFATTG